MEKGKEHTIEIPMGDLAKRGAYVMDELHIDLFKMSSILMGLTGIDKRIWADKMAEMRLHKLRGVV
jgi:hypothetical protein